MSYTRSARYRASQLWGTSAVATAAANVYVNLNDQPCDEVTILLSSTDVAIDVLSVNGDAPVKLDAPSGTTIPVSGNAKEITVRRNDASATPVNVRYIWRKYNR